MQQSGFGPILLFSHLFGGHGSGYGGRHGGLQGFQHGGGHDADICDCH